MIDVKKALNDPSAVFKNPQDVIETGDLSREQKIEILRRWEYDIRELQVADEEGMAPADPQPVILDAVLNALRSLGARQLIPSALLRQNRVENEPPRRHEK